MSVAMLVAAFLGLFFTIVSSAVGVCAWVTTRLARIETDLKHAFLRVNALEDAAARIAPAAAPRQARRKRK